MKDFFQGIGIFGTLIVAVVVLGALSAFGDYAYYAYFTPRYIAVQNSAFKQSQAYNDGMANEVGNKYEDFVNATDPTVKASIGAVVRNEFRSYDATKLPPDTRTQLLTMETYGQ